MGGCVPVFRNILGTVWITSVDSSPKHYLKISPASPPRSRWYELYLVSTGGSTSPRRIQGATSVCVTNSNGFEVLPPHQTPVRALTQATYVEEPVCNYDWVSACQSCCPDVPTLRTRGRKQHPSLSPCTLSCSEGRQLWKELSWTLFNWDIEQTQSRLYTTGDWEVFFTKQACWQSLFKTWYQKQFTVESLPQ